MALPAVAVPVSRSERLVALDVLRGLAVLGILLLNIQSFALPFAAYSNPTALGAPAPRDFLIWALTYVFAASKFMTMFSLLFGAGVLLMARRLEARGTAVAPLHYRRMTWLFVFGVVHAYALWYGDILVLYAVCGMLILPARRLPAASLLPLGIAGLALTSSLSIATGLFLRTLPPDAIASIEQFWQPSPEAIAAEIAAFQGGWLDQMAFRARYSLDVHTFQMWIFGVPYAAGLMLVGMALVQWGVLTGAREPSFYRRLGIGGLAVGLPMAAWAVRASVADGWTPASFFLAFQWNHWGSLPASLGWIGITLWLWRIGAMRRLFSRLAAVGRAAFSAYILETLICTSLFYGHGLGLFGTVDRLGQLLIVIAIWVVLLIAAPWWLARYPFGPLEWLWRRLTYGRLVEWPHPSSTACSRRSDSILMSWRGLLSRG